ncbi:MAG TPA: hypothetical protein VF721_04230, partial [Pyrinomonadaceae bacterium]
MKKIFFLTIFLTILFVNAFVIRAQIMPCTLSKATTLPLAGEYGSFGQFAVTRLTIPNPDPNAPAPISV